jgi:hypothetical protein
MVTSTTQNDFNLRPTLTAHDLQHRLHVTDQQNHHDGTKSFEKKACCYENLFYLLREEGRH